MNLLYAHGLLGSERRLSVCSVVDNTVDADMMDSFVRSDSHHTAGKFTSRVWEARARSARPEATHISSIVYWELST